MSFFHICTIGHFDPIEFLISGTLTIKRAISKNERNALLDFTRLRLHKSENIENRFGSDGLLRLPRSGDSPLFSKWRDIAAYAHQQFAMSSGDLEHRIIDCPNFQFYTLGYFDLGEEEISPRMTLKEKVTIEIVEELEARLRAEGISEVSVTQSLTPRGLIHLHFFPNNRSFQQARRIMKVAESDFGMNSVFGLR